MSTLDEFELASVLLPLLLVSPFDNEKASSNMFSCGRRLLRLAFRRHGKVNPLASGSIMLRSMATSMKETTSATQKAITNSFPSVSGSGHGHAKESQSITTTRQNTKQVNHLQHQTSVFLLHASRAAASRPACSGDSERAMAVSVETSASPKMIL